MPNSSAPAQFRRRPWVLLALGLAGLAALFAWDGYGDYQAVGAQEQERLLKLAEIVEVNLSRRLQGTGNGLDAIRAELPALLARPDGRERLRQRLATLATAMSGVRALEVVDAAGAVVASSDAALIGRPVRGSDRSATSSTATDPRTLHLGVPTVDARESPLEAAQVILDAQGRFDGVVRAILDRDYLRVLMASVLYAPDMRASLIFGDGRVVFRVPDPEALTGQDLTANPRAQVPRHLESGRKVSVFAGPTAAPGDERLVVVRSIRPQSTPADQVLVAALSRAVPAVYAAWSREVLTRGLLVAVLALIGVLALLAHQRGRRAADRLLAAAQAERAASEETARRQLAELQAVYDATPVGLGVMDRGLRYLRVNECLAELDGRPPAAHLGRTLREVHPEIAACVEPLLRRVLATGEPVVNLELAGRPRGPAGTTPVLRVSYHPLRNPDGAIVALTGVVEDITEYKQTEANLRESERRFRALFEHLPVAYQSLDAEGRWLDANQHLAELLGFEHPGDLLGQRFVDYWDDLIRARFDEGDPGFGAGHSIEGELLLHRRDGSPVTVMLAGRVQRDTAGRVLCTHCVLSDISERRAMEDAVRALNADLEAKVEARTAEARAASEAKSAFLAHMSHEIRTPLNAVLGLAQVLSRGPLDGAQRDMVARIQGAGESLLVILNDILDLSKIEAGRLHIEHRPFDLGALLAHVHSILGASAQAKGLELRIEAPAAPPGPLSGDALRLEQVLLNLVGNAIKFTERGAVELAVGIDTQADGTLWLRCAVRDTGIGIAPAALERLFTPFTQADGGISRRFGGTGLGLAICKRLVELMGGTIGAESRVGEGSQFWFTLPLARAAGPAAPPPVRAAAPAVGPRLSGARVLVVDDSPMNRDLVERALAIEGAEATLAADGRQALELLRARPGAFDAVLMDIQMPILDGLSATRLIRAEPALAGLLVIALTAGVLEEQQEAARAAGMDAVLPKPLDLEQMAVLLAERLGPRPLPAAPGGGGRAVATAAAPTGFPMVPGIDLEQASLRLGGDRPLFLRLLRGFVEESRETPDAARRAFAAGAPDAAARYLHTLRGNAGTLGALDLAAAAGALEEAIGAGETALEARLADLEAQAAALFAGCERVLDAAGPPGAAADAAGQAGEGPAPARLAALYEALHGQDLAALRRFEDLEAALTRTLGEAATAELALAVRALRFTDALAVLDRAGALPRERADPIPDPPPGVNQEETRP